MPGRSFCTSSYRFGFNGKEKDDEISGTGNQYDYGFRIYNPRLGKFLSVDPLTKSYPWYTPYQFAGNKPIWAVDLDGLEEFIVTVWWQGNTKYTQIKCVVDYCDEEVKKGENVKGFRFRPYFQETDKAHRVQYIVTDKKGKTTISWNETFIDARESTAILSKMQEKQSTFEYKDKGKDKEGKGFVEGEYIAVFTETFNPPKIAAPPPQKPDPPINIPVPPVPPDPNGMCFDCYIGVQDIHWANGVSEIANWLLNNPNYNLQVKADGGATWNVFDNEWDSGATAWFDRDQTLEQRVRSQFGKLQEAVKKASGGKVTSDRLVLKLGNPDGRGLKYTGEKKQ